MKSMMNMWCLIPNFNKSLSRSCWDSPIAHHSLFIICSTPPWFELLTRQDNDGVLNLAGQGTPSFLFILCRCPLSVLVRSVLIGQWRVQKWFSVTGNIFPPLPSVLLLQIHLFPPITLKWVLRALLCSTSISSPFRMYSIAIIGYRKVETSSGFTNWQTCILSVYRDCRDCRSMYIHEGARFSAVARFSDVL